MKIKKQKVHFRKRRIEAPQKPRRPRFRSFAQFFLVALVVGGIGIALVSLKCMFLETGYFVVKAIDVKLQDAGSTRSLSLADFGNETIIGANIFFIDLNEFKRKVESSHTEFKDVIVRRILPNKLIIEAQLRKPIAQIRSDRYYFVDKEGVMLPDVKNFPDPDLPIIFGIGVNLAKVKPYNFTELERDRIGKALGIIKGMRDIEGLEALRLKSVDVTDPGNLSFFLEKSNVEIKIGNSDFEKRLRVLARLLEQVGPDVDSFKYIDLRFEDPIIGPR